MKNIDHHFSRNAVVGWILLVSAVNLSAQEESREGAVTVLPAQEQAGEEEATFLERTGFALRMGTTGIGLDAAYRALPWVTARLEASHIPRLGFEVSSVRLDIQSFSAALIGDAYPWQDDGFHVSAGLAYARPSLSGEYQNTKSEITWGPLAGYVGIGFGNVAAEEGLIGVVFDLGVFLSIAKTDMNGAEALKQIKLNATRNAAGEYELLLPWPVLSVGVALRPGR